MDSGNKHDDEVDIFELAGAQPKPASPVEHIETETNVFFVETLRQAAAQHGGADTGAFEVSKPAQAADTAGAAHDDDLDDDFPQKKGGFFAKLFGRGARGDDKDEDSDDLSLDDDMFIAPPPASERAGSGAAAATPPSVSEPTTVATVPEVTDSGVFEFKPSSHEPVPEKTDEVVIVATVPEVTESGIFELEPTASEPVQETKEEAVIVATVPEVTESGIFELEPSSNEPVPETKEEAVIVATVPEVTESGVFEIEPSSNEAVPETKEEAVIVATVPEVTESGIFEIEPSSNEAVPETKEEAVIVATVPEVTDSGVFELGPPANNEPAVAATVPEVTDSGVFELGPPPAAPSHPHGAQKGDEWEIGWEPEGEEAAAAAPAADVQAAPDAPPPVFTRLAHVCLYVGDLGRSVEYYCKLGFRKRFVFNRNGRLFGAYLEFGEGNFIELFEDTSRGAVTAPGRLAHFCLETPDIDAAMEALSARGIAFSPKKLGSDSTYQIWLKDPDGNDFEIHQYTEKSSQLIGGEVEADW